MGDIKVVLPPSSLAKFKVSLDLESPISKIETLGIVMFSDVLYVDFRVFRYPSIEFELKRKLNWITWEVYPEWIYLQQNNGINNRVYNVAYNLIEFAKQKGAFIFFTDWEEREDIFLKLMEQYPSLQNIKEYKRILNISMLIQNILGFLIYNEISPNIRKISDNALNFISRVLPLFKEELQDAVLHYSKIFKNQYYLNQQNKEWLKEEITQGQNQVLNILSLENAKPSIPKYVKTVFEFALSYTPISPVLPVVDVVKKFREYMRAKNILKTPQAKLGWATLMLKKLSPYLETINKPNKCIVCSLTLDDIQNMDEAEAEETIRKMMSNPEEFMCETHMMAWLDIRKQFALTGKSLLLAMKEYYKGR